MPQDATEPRLAAIRAARNASTQLRALVVQAVHDGIPLRAIAAAAGTSAQTPANWAAADDDWTDNATETTEQCANCDTPTNNWCQICKRALCRDCVIDHAHLGMEAHGGATTEMDR